MAGQDNVQVAQQAYEAFGRGDIPTVMAKLTDDIEWVVPGPSDVPTYGTCRGKQAVGEWFGIVGQTFDFQVFNPYEYIAQGDKLATLVHTEVTVRHNGQKIAQDEAHIWSFRDGKVAKIEIFENTAQVAAAYRQT